MRAHSDAERDARRSGILDAAARIARDSGIKALSVRDVAAAADVSVGNVYRYFESIEDLQASLIARGLERALRHLERRLPQRGSHASQLRRLCTSYVDGLIEHADLFEATVRLRFELRNAKLRPASADELRAMVRASIAPFEGIIAAGQRSGDFALKPPARQTATALWSALNGLLMTFGGDPSRTEAEGRRFLLQQAELVAGLYLEAIRGPGQRSPSRQVP